MLHTYPRYFTKFWRQITLTDWGVHLSTPSQLNLWRRSRVWFVEWKLRQSGLEIRTDRSALRANVTFTFGIWSSVLANAKPLSCRALASFEKVQPVPLMYYSA